MSHLVETGAWGGIDLRHSHLCSVADLFVSFFCLGGESVWTFTVSWNAGNAMCKVFKFWQVRSNQSKDRVTILHLFL